MEARNFANYQELDTFIKEELLRLGPYLFMYLVNNPVDPNQVALNFWAGDQQEYGMQLALILTKKPEVVDENAPIVVPPENQ